MTKWEQKFYRNRVQPVLKKVPGLTFDRVESHSTASGFPDVVYTRRGRTGFVELKSVKLVNSWVPLDGWAENQRSWALRHLRQGAVVWLLVECRPNETRLIPVTRELVDSAGTSVTDGVEWCLGVAKEAL